LDPAADTNEEPLANTIALAVPPAEKGLPANVELQVSTAPLLNVIAEASAASNLCGFDIVKLPLIDPVAPVGRYIAIGAEALIVRLDPEAISSPGWLPVIVNLGAFEYAVLAAIVGEVSPVVKCVLSVMAVTTDKAVFVPVKSSSPTEKKVVKAVPDPTTLAELDARLIVPAPEVAPVTDEKITVALPMIRSLPIEVCGTFVTVGLD
jgi:hypothetical protein